MPKEAYGDLWGQSTILESIIGNYPWPGEGRGIRDGIRADPWLWAIVVDGEPIGSHLIGQRYWVQTASQEDSHVNQLVRHNEDVVRFKLGGCDTLSMA